MTGRSLVAPSSASARGSQNVSVPAPVSRPLVGAPRAQCGDFGHTHALKTEDGKYLTFLPNEFSSNLLAGEKFHDKAVAVHGVYYANANQLDVETYTIDGKAYGWCDHCTAMDGCSMAKK